MKVLVKYFTEFGIQECVLMITELADFIKRFRISSIDTIENREIK